MQSRQRVDSPVARLAEHPQLRRAMMIRESRALATPECAEELLAKARNHRLDRPDRASRWACLAWIAAERVSGVEGNRLRALAAAEDANALRLMGDWRRAETKIALAHSQLRPDMDRERLEVWLMEASLAIQREEWIRVWDRLQWATDMAERLDDKVSLYRALVKRGMACTRVGDYLEAVRLFRDAVAAAPEQRELRLQALHNLIGVYAEAGWAYDGMERLRRMEPLYQGMGRLWSGRALWYRGRFLLRLGPASEAVQALRSARQIIEEHCRYAELAEVLCDEAEAHLVAGSSRETVEELAGAAGRAFAAVGLGRLAARAAGLIQGSVAMARAESIATVRDWLRERRTRPMRRRG